RRASISIPSMAARSYDSPMHARLRRCGRQLTGSLTGLNSRQFLRSLREFILSNRSVQSAAAPQLPLAAMLWPARPGETVGALRAFVLVALGTALMALSAKV